MKEQRSTSEELRQRQQIRDFAHQLDASSFILRRLNFPLHKLRDIVDGLQGAAGGRPAFELSFLALARRLRHTGKDETAETYAQRKVAALDKAQRRAGRMLFTVHRGGGIEHKRTRYDDHLTPVANWMMQQARESDLWAQHPARAIESFVDEAIEMLPPAPEEGKEEQDPMPIDDRLYIQRMINQGVSFALKACDGAAEIGIDDIAVARMAAERLQRYAEDRHRARQAGEGVQICTPSDEPEEVGRGTNLYPSPSEASQNLEEKPDMFAAARALAAKGFRPFPLHWIKPDGSCSCPEGANCKSPGKHPRIGEWQKLSTTEERWLRVWFEKQWPGANVGILTGEPSSLCVIDVDFRAGGDATLGELCDLHGDGWLNTLSVRTGGGIHLYFRHPEGLDLRNTAGRIGEGVDSRANGGFVVAPPSLHASGRRYEWANDLEPAPLPDWLIKLLTEGKAAAARPGAKPGSQAKSGTGIGLVITEGGRNDALFKIGCSLRGKGAELPEIEAELLDHNARRCSPPLPEVEVLKTARSAASYAANRVATGG